MVRSSITEPHEGEEGTWTARNVRPVDRKQGVRELTSEWPISVAAPRRPTTAETQEDEYCNNGQKCLLMDSVTGDNIHSLVPVPSKVGWVSTPTTHGLPISGSPGTVIYGLPVCHVLTQCHVVGLLQVHLAP